MTPTIVSSVSIGAAARILSSPTTLPWPQVWASLENFCALALYKLVLGVPTVPEVQSAAILHEQLTLRGTGDLLGLSRDVLSVLRGDQSLDLALQHVLDLAKRLQTMTPEALKVECKALVPQVTQPPAPKLACPVAWLLTDKGCTKSLESEQVMQAARRLCLAEEPVPYVPLLKVLQEAYAHAQHELLFASSRTKVAVQPVVDEVLARDGLTMWSRELSDLMTVLGTAAHVNRRRSLRALSKVQHVTVDEVMRQIQLAAEQSDLIEMLDAGVNEWDDSDSS